MGGFIVEDDDDEEGPSSVSSNAFPMPLNVNAMQDHSGATNRAISRSPLSNTVSQNVSIQYGARDVGASAQSDLSNAVPNPATLTSDHGARSNESSVSKPSQILPASELTATASSNTSVSGSSASAIPRARLPHDRIGMLEDRIKDDPRGDMDAWLSLISEHRKRNKLDDARNVYERFFKVFPHAVGF
jgi:cleavage stimulation factor subunit 3